MERQRPRGTPKYDFTLYWLAENRDMPPRASTEDATEPGPTIFWAVQEQLGLKLERSAWDTSPASIEEDRPRKAMVCPTCEVLYDIKHKT
jgi:hypothetical protein